MPAIDTAGIYPEIQSMYTGSMTPGEICYKVYWLVTIDPCVAKDTYSYDIYHKGDITLPQKTGHKNQLMLQVQRSNSYLFS
jgi:hypothetical protein